MSKSYLRDLPTRTPRRQSTALRYMSVRVAAGAVMTVLLLLSGAGSALAHTSFESSSPADGAVFDGPVSTVTISFSDPATPVDDQFVALDSTGQIRTPSSVTSVEGRIFELTFDPALTGGEIGIRWKVQAGDAHPIEGVFSFTASAPVAEATVADPLGDSAAELVGASGTTTLDEFLMTDSSSEGETASTLGRVIGLLGVVLGLGVLVFVASVLRGTRPEVEFALNAVRVLGLVIAAGATFEYTGVVQLTGGSLFTGFTSAPGFATVLRIGGGLALALGLVSTMVPIRASRQRQPMSLSAAVLDLERLSLDEPQRQQPHQRQQPRHRQRQQPHQRQQPRHRQRQQPHQRQPPPQRRRQDSERRERPSLARWQGDSRSWRAFAGVVAIIISFWFDGHTVSKGYRPLHALTNSIHLVAGSVWAGGVIAMAVIFWRRSRRGHPMRVLDLVLRFSPIATIALAAVAGAGLLMAVFVLDSFAELTGTPWGQILLLKTAAVGLTAIGGAYNHFRLIPALEAAPDDEELLAEVRATIMAEAILLVFVVVVTAWLVAAAS